MQCGLIQTQRFMAPLAQNQPPLHPQQLPQGVTQSTLIKLWILREELWKQILERWGVPNVRSQQGRAATQIGQRLPSEILSRRKVFPLNQE